MCHTIDSNAYSLENKYEQQKAATESIDGYSVLSYIWNLCISMYALARENLKVLESFYGKIGTRDNEYYLFRRV